MKENATWAIVIECAVELNQDLHRITRIIHGNLDAEPPCLSASVKHEVIPRKEKKFMPKEPLVVVCVMGTYSRGCNCQPTDLPAGD